MRHRRTGAERTINRAASSTHKGQASRTYNLYIPPPSLQDLPHPNPFPFKNSLSGVEMLFLDSDRIVEIVRSMILENLNWGIT
jgi:hypothetical protein